MTRWLPTFVILLVGGWNLMPAERPVSPTIDITERIRQLDDERFAVRRDAHQQLLKLGPSILPQLRSELAKATSAEVRMQLQRIIADLSALPWQIDPAIAIAEAKRSGKPILAFSTIGDADGFS